MSNWKRIENITNDVAVIRPVYTDTGKATELLTADGCTYLDTRDVCSVLAALFRCHHIDPRAQKTTIRNLLGQQFALPFYLTPDRVFVPFKMRQARAQHDSVYGYADLAFISAIRPAPGNRCTLILTNGHSVDLCCTRTTALKSYDAAAQLAKHLNPTNKEDDIRGLVLSAVAALLDELLFIRTYLEQQRD